MNNELNISGLKQGVVIGGICSIAAFMLIMIGRDTYINTVDWMTSITSIGLVIYFGRKERAQNFEGFLKYGPAFVYASIAFFVSSILVQVSNIAVCQIIDPGIQEAILKTKMAAMEEGLRITEGLIDMPESEIDKALDQTERDIKISFTPYSLVSNSWASLLGSMILGAIVALFIKKSKPDFVEE